MRMVLVQLVQNMDLRQQVLVVVAAVPVRGVEMAVTENLAVAVAALLALVQPQ